MRTRAVRVAIEEGEVRRHQIGPVGHSNGQLGGEVMSTRRDRRQQICPRCGAIHAIGLPRGIRDQGFIEGRERAQELSGESRQILDDELEGPGGGALQLIWRDGGDRRTSTALVGDPIQRILGGILTIAAQVAFVLQRAPPTIRILGAQAVPAGLVNGALLNLDLRDLLLRQHVEVHQL